VAGGDLAVGDVLPAHQRDLKGEREHMGVLKRNRIAAIPNAVFRVSSAGTGTTVSQNGATGPLQGPLGLAIAPGGDVLTVNSGDGNIVETSPADKQVVAIQTIDSAGAGSLFGLAVAPQGTGVYFVDDALNNLDLLH
jgi:hypothetical protein